MLNPQPQTVSHEVRSLHDGNDITKGEERVKSVYKKQPEH